jgi:hypothetical protein
MRLWLSLFAVLLVTASCGGGGGGGGGSSAAPAAQSTASPLSQNTTVQRALVQQGLTSTSDSAEIAQFAGGSASTLSVVRRALSERRSAGSVSGCSNGTVETIGAGNPSAITIDTYYDPGCTSVWWVGQFEFNETSSSSGTLTGSYTYYTAAGTVYEYVSPVTVTLGGIGTSTEFFSVGAGIATSPTVGPTVSFGVGCNLTSAADSCSFATAAHLAATSLDQGESATVSASLSGTTQTVIVLSGSGSAYTAPLNALSVIAQGQSGWAVSGAAPSVSVNLSGSISYGGTGALAAETLTVSDSADDATVAMTFNAASQLIAGTVTQTGSGTVVATFSVSPAGTGTVTYGNGTTAQIVNWVVQS